jgi:hypothetical protein
MKISKLKEAIREMVIDELASYSGPESVPALQKDPNFQKSKDKDTLLNTLKSGGTVNLQEDEALNEMASLVQASKEARRQGKNQEAKALETTEEKTIEQFKTAGISPNPKTGGLTGFASQYKKNLKNDFNIDLQKLFNDLEEQAEKDGENFNASIAINSIEKTAANKLTGKEIGQRGRKADPNKPAAEPKEPGMRGRPKSATPKMSVSAKKAAQKTFKMGDERKYYADDKEGPSDAELRTLAKSGGKVEKSKVSQLRQQEKTKMVKAFLKGLKDKGIVDNANRVLDKEKYAAEWAKAKPSIDAAITKLK